MYQFSKTYISVVIALLLTATTFAQKSAKAEKAIRTVMAEQEVAWNNGNLEAFMEGYLHTDSLCFVGSRGLTYGWAATLANYRKGYPSRDAMGTLNFDILKVDVLSKKSAFVIGKWHLTRKSGDVGGHYTLLWKKVNGKWLIVADHSS